MTATLANLRAAALKLADLPDGHPGTWRQITTDTYGDTGIGLTCHATGDADHHDHDDYDNGSARDEHGQYDCCPTTVIEAWSEPIAAYLVALLNADREETGR